MSDEKTKPTPPPVMSEEEKKKLIDWYNDQIEMAELRHKLTRLQSETVEYEAKRLQSLGIIANMKMAGSSPQNKNEEESDKLDSEESEK